MALSVESFCRYYMFHPNHLPKEKDKVIALVSSIALGILTLGLMHLICYTALYNRNIVAKQTPDAQDKKASEIFHKKVRRKRVRKKRDPRLAKFLNLEVSLEAAKKMAREGDVGWQIFLGKQYYLGKNGIERSLEQSIKWYQMALEHNDRRAQYRIGKMYLYGQGLQQNIDQGLSLIKLSSQQGYIRARNFLN